MVEDWTPRPKTAENRIITASARGGIEVYFPAKGPVDEDWLACTKHVAGAFERMEVARASPR